MGRLQLAIECRGVGGGTLKVTLTGPDSFLSRTFLQIHLDAVTRVKVRMRLPACNTEGQLFWTTSEEPGLADDRYLNFPVTPDGERHEYEIPIAEHAKWRGQAIRGIRLDPTTGGGEPGSAIEIDWIRGE